MAAYEATGACCSASTSCSSVDLFTSTLKLIAASQCCFTDDFESDEIKDKDCFDFIIVGGGTSGNVLANRLSEVEGWNVLLLEAGPKPPIFSSIPQLSRFLAKTEYDWNYTTVNNYKTSQALKTGQVTWVRGKLLGGSSVTNGGFYGKGIAPDFQRWADAGNPSWTPENVFKYERKAESLQNEALENNSRVGSEYGSDGPQVINRYNTTRMPVHRRILDSWQGIGLQQVEDTNSAVYTSRGYCSPAVFTAGNGVRYDTYRSYLLPVDERTNLKIVADAFVSKILVDDNKKAYGVEVTVNGQNIQVYVSKEVILAAGAVNSPHLMLLSGMGPKSQLQSKNVTVVVNLPAVGRNLQDHLKVIIPIYGDRSPVDNRSERKCAVEEYCRTRTGYLAQGSLEDISAFYSTHPYLNYPEFQNLALIMYENGTEYINSLGFKKEVTESLFKYIPDKTLYLFYVILLHPDSRGTIKLKTGSANEPPIIDPNYFGSNRDLVLTTRGIMKLTEILNTKFFKSINAYIPRIKLADCDHLKFNTYEYWKCYARNMVTSVFRPAGACKMGKYKMSSVVNDSLQVYGVTGLRIIDESVMPTHVSGSYSGAILSIGEFGADMIKESYNEELSNYLNSVNY